MNSLARAVYDVIVGGKPIETASRGLTVRDGAALVDMQPVLDRDPRDLAKVLALEGPQIPWKASPPALAQPGP